MPTWSSEQYLRFARERTRPSRDLAAQVEVPAGGAVLDVGCGPGNSTAVLAERFPGADVTGVDVSADMLARARADHPELRFAELDVTGDLSALEGRFDLVFSNACLQWVADHHALLPRLMRLLEPGGSLAVQMPLAHRQVMYREVVWPLAESERWRGKLGVPRAFYVREPQEYLDILAGCASDVDLWVTTYYHLLDGPEAVVAWFRGSGLRPYLQALELDDAARFEAEVLDRVREVFTPLADGRVPLRFPRLFFVARR